MKNQANKILKPGYKREGQFLASLDSSLYLPSLFARCSTGCPWHPVKLPIISEIIPSYFVCLKSIWCLSLKGKEIKWLSCFVKECQPVAICTFVNGVWLLNVKWRERRKLTGCGNIDKAKGLYEIYQGSGRGDRFTGYVKLYHTTCNYSA